MQRVMRLLWIGLLLLSACAPSLPEWAGGISEEYPPELYLVGVGVGPERTVAEDRARAAIAKVFEVRILAQDTSVESSWTARIGERERAEYTQSVAAALLATTDRRLRGVRIAEVWQDEGSEVYALAVLDRMQAARPLREALTELDMRVAALVEQADAERQTLRRFGQLLEALQLLEVRREYASDLAILLSGGYVTAAPHSRAEVASRLDAAAAAVRLGLELEGDRDEIVKGALIAALARYDIRIAPVYAQDLVIHGVVSTESFQAGGPWHWTTAAAQVQFRLADGTPLDSLRLTVREGSQVPSQSRIRAFERLGDELAEALLGELVRQGFAGR